MLFLALCLAACIFKKDLVSMLQFAEVQLNETGHLGPACAGSILGAFAVFFLLFLVIASKPIEETKGGAATSVLSSLGAKNEPSAV